MTRQMAARKAHLAVVDEEVPETAEGYDGLLMLLEFPSRLTAWKVKKNLLISSTRRLYALHPLAGNKICFLVASSECRTHLHKGANFVLNQQSQGEY